MYLHGTPSCRLEPAAFGVADAASRRGIRLIAPDRPGIGRSDALPERRVLDYPADIAFLADHLRIGRFAVATSGPRVMTAG